MDEIRERKSVLLIREWHGQFSNVSVINRPGGAMVEQVNVTCLVEGELRVRDGFREVQFDA